jgi:glucokinase
MINQSIIGVDLGGTNVRCGLVKGQTIAKVYEQPISSRASEDQVLKEIIYAIEQVLEPDAIAIGLGVPGIVDTEKGIVFDVQNIPAWKETHLKEIIERHFNIPVYLNNDANCFAAGEWYYGLGAGCKNIVGLITGTGVAAGIIIKGQLYEGNHCGAGEFGMIPYKDHNLEFYCGGNFFRYFYHTTGEILYKQAKQGDVKALQIFDEYGMHLSWAIKTVMYTLSPEMIIIGGSVSKAYEFYQKSLKHHLSNFPYKPVLDSICITPSRTENIAILGAAALYFGTTGKNLRQYT